MKTIRPSLVLAMLLALFVSFPAPSRAEGRGASPKATTFWVADAARAVRSYLEKLHGAEWSRFELLDVRWPNGAPPAEGRLGLLTGDGNPTPNGSLLLQADVSVGIAPPSRLPLLATVRPWVKAPVAAGAIPRGALLTAADLRIEERPLADLRGAQPAALGSGSSARLLRTRRDIKAGDVLLASMVEEPPVVTSGSRVTVRLDSGSIRLATLGIARRAGRRGETIPVENLNSRKTLLAQVLDEHTVVMTP